MAEEDRPRERLARHGASAMSEAELIAILLRVGVQGLSAVQVGQGLLDKFSGIQGLAQAGVDEMALVKGVGPAKAVQLKAAFELGVRFARQERRVRVISTPEQVDKLLGDEMRMLTAESVRAILVDTRLQLKGVEEISKGLLNEALVRPREFFAAAIARKAYGAFLVHNHPSGDPTPSQADIRLTREIAEAGKLLQIPLIDHIIVGHKSPACPGGWFSFKSAGYL